MSVGFWNCNWDTKKSAQCTYRIASNCEMVQCKSNKCRFYKPLVINISFWGKRKKKQSNKLERFILGRFRLCMRFLYGNWITFG